MQQDPTAEWAYSLSTDAGEMVCRTLLSHRLGDLDLVFGERSTARRCYCTYWRRPAGGFGDARDNRERFADLIDDILPTGLIGYVDDEPVGWVQVGPRATFPTLLRSRLLRPVDEVEPWAINCFVVRSGWRKKGIAGGLLDAAVRYARDRGADVIEAYPVDGPRSSAVDYYTGTMSMFRRQGFREVLRRNSSRPIVRLD